MFSKLFVAALCASVAAGKIIDLGDYTFEKYVADFNLNYHPSEVAARKATFATELARVQAHNAKNLSWKETMNKFSLLSAKEKKTFKGRHKGAARQTLKSAKPLPADFVMKPVSALPATVDWRNRGKFIVCAMLFVFFCVYTPLSICKNKL